MSSERKPDAGKRKAFKNGLHHWLRWLHLYTSMLSLMVVLFFAVTGLTLNHPEWQFGGKPANRVTKGTLKPGFQNGGQVDWFKVVEQLRQEQPVHGAAVDARVDGDEGSLSFKAPGSVCDVFFKMDSGEYEMSTVEQGLLGVMNDLHRGRDSGAAWAWVIDISAVFLTLISVTGLGILFYLKKSRVAGLIVGLAGLVAVAILSWLASR